MASKVASYRGRSRARQPPEPDGMHEGRRVRLGVRSAGDGELQIIDVERPILAVRPGRLHPAVRGLEGYAAAANGPPREWAAGNRLRQHRLQVGDLVAGGVRPPPPPAGGRGPRPPGRAGGGGAAPPPPQRSASNGASSRCDARTDLPASVHQVVPRRGTPE